MFEQSYLPSMIDAQSFDTIYEHLEYYTLSQINWMLKACNMKILDFSLNDTNGGSIWYMHQNQTLENIRKVNKYLVKEKKNGYLKTYYWDSFKKKTNLNISKIKNFFKEN